MSRAPFVMPGPRGKQPGYQHQTGSRCCAHALIDAEGLCKCVLSEVPTASHACTCRLPWMQQCGSSQHHLSTQSHMMTPVQQGCKRDMHSRGTGPRCTTWTEQKIHYCLSPQVCHQAFNFAASIHPLPSHPSDTHSLSFPYNFSPHQVGQVLLHGLSAQPGSQEGCIIPGPPVLMTTRVCHC